MEKIKGEIELGNCILKPNKYGIAVIPKENIKEKTADEMFEELRYTKVLDNDIKIWYTGTTIHYIAEIMFWKKTKTFDLEGLNWSMEELQAINKKCQELRLVRR